MNKLIWGFLFICMCMPVYAGMVGYSHNDRNAIGRNRANVMKPVNVSLPTPAIHNPVQDIEPADINDGIEPEPEIIPEPEPDLTAYIAAATEYITQLQTEINQIDSEIARCKGAKRNWTIGTIVGGAGVVGTATGAIVQAVQINKAKKNGATESAPDDKAQESQ